MAPKDPTEIVEPGSFPFPLTDGPRESEYLTWIRNHSNYMAVRGLLDYLRAISVLLRGILVNFLIFLPNLLLLSILVAVAYFYGQPPPYIFTKALLILFCVWILLFPIATPFFRIIRYKTANATGSDSSVQQRDKYERVFGGFLFSIFAVAAIESFPGMLELFHSNISLPTFASTAAGITALFSVVPKLISNLGEGLAKKLAVIVVGLLGLIVPLSVVFAVAGFIVFSPPADWTIYALFGGLIFPILTIIAVAIGIVLGAFKRKDIAGVCLVVFASVGLVVLVNYVDDSVYSTFLHDTELAQDEAFASIQEDVDAMFGMLDLVEKQPGDTLVWISNFLNGEITARDSSIQVPAAYEALVQTAERAGLYPEFEVFDQAVAANDDLCAAAGLPADECEELSAEIEHLHASAAILSDAFATETPADVALHLLSLPQNEMDTLLTATYSYPYLQDILGVRWNAMANVCSPKDAEEDTPFQACSAEDDNDLPRFCVVQCTFANFGERFQDTRREIAATASDSLVETSFYESGIALEVRENKFWPKAIFVAIFALQLWFFCWLTIDVNLTSIHGLYRDRLASAFLVGINTDEVVDIEKDIDLMEIANYKAGSVAPYHLINTALNLQGSGDISIRDRNSDFFVFSKKFIGGLRTGYCRSENMEKVFPQMDLATAMAISAAAASPNMGRMTSPGHVAIMTLLNIRLGFWIPNPDVLEKWLATRGQHPDTSSKKKEHVLTFEKDVFIEELAELSGRWQNLYQDETRTLDDTQEKQGRPSPAHRLAGIGYSGGGIRSATVNLGITQALEKAGVFKHMDYMSTVSGGGYLGSSISTLMRQKDEPVSGGEDAEGVDAVIEEVTEGIKNSVGQIFRWRIRPAALLREALGSVNETSNWVNVSDGGHIENLACIELLRRRCKYIIIGDGEADPDHSFNGLATLIRMARIDLGVELKIKADPLRLGSDNTCDQHWAIGKIEYPEEQEHGYLLYVKSSFTGDEDELIRQYRSVNPLFPHQSTADQFFSEGQFEAYRSLGQHIGEQVLVAGKAPLKDEGKMSFAKLEQWFEALYKSQHA